MNERPNGLSRDVPVRSFCRRLSFDHCRRSTCAQDDRLLALHMMLKAADISNISKPWAVRRGAVARLLTSAPHRWRANGATC